MINVWFAITVADAQDIKQNFADFPAEVKEALRNMKADAHWKRFQAGGKTYLVVDTNAEKNWIQRLQQKYPDTVVLGAWDFYTGDILYPIHSRILEIMEDDVVYDENGNEISRTPATVPKQCHKWLGQKDGVNGETCSYNSFRWLCFRSSY